jgi:hypothetical protein
MTAHYCMQAGDWPYIEGLHEASLSTGLMQPQLTRGGMPIPECKFS